MAAESTNVTVTMTVTRCEGLHDTASFGKQDPFVKFQCAGQGGKTPVAKDMGTAPEWTEGNVFKFVFADRDTVNEPDTKLYISIYNMNTFGYDGIAKAVYEMKDLTEVQGEPKWWAVKNDEGELEGNIELIMTVDDPVEQARIEAEETAREEEMKAAMEAAAEEARAQAEAEAAEEEAKAAAEEKARLAQEAYAAACARAAEQREKAAEAARAALAAREAEEARLAAQREKEAAAPKTRVFVSDLLGGADVNEVEFSVPEGYKIVGGGWRFFNAEDKEGNTPCAAVASYPKDQTTWAVSSTHLAKPGFEHHVQIHAVGLHDPEDKYSVEYFETTTEEADPNPSGVSAVPEGYKLVGGGFKINSDNDLKRCVVTTTGFSLEDPQAWGVTGNSWGRDDAATITAYAIGLKENEGTPPVKVVNRVQRAMKKAAYRRKPLGRGEDFKSWQITCGSGYVVNDAEVLETTHPIIIRHLYCAKPNCKDFDEEGAFDKEFKMNIVATHAHFGKKNDVWMHNGVTLIKQE